MADTPKTPTAAAAAELSTPTAAELNTILDGVEAESMKLAGVKGVNPFIYVRDNITPLRAAIKAGPITSELVAKVKVVKPLTAPAAPAKQ